MDSKIVVSPDQLKTPPKKIGTLKGQPVYHLLGKGGINIILAKSHLGSRILGTGNHIAISRFVAKETEPEIVFDELSKSEDLPYAAFKHLIPFYTEYTKRLDVKLNESDK